MKQKDNFQKLISDKPSTWNEKAAYRSHNKEWLDKSAKIAFKILRELRNRKMTQVELAGKLGVSPQYVNKIMKGKENMQLETICKIESILDIVLFEVPGLSYVSLSVSASNYKTQYKKTNMVSSPVLTEKYDNIGYGNYSHDSLEAV